MRIYKEVVIKDIGFISARQAYAVAHFMPMCTNLYMTNL